MVRCGTGRAERGHGLIGSGVGASLISGGATYQGATSSAAEFGHVTVAVGGRKCRCGASGCLEAYAGAAAILERYGRPMAANDQELALAELIDAADTSPLAAAVLDETARYLGAGIGTLVNLFNPERVILGGWAACCSAPASSRRSGSRPAKHSLRHLFAATSIELGQLGPGAVARGAATLPMETFLNGLDGSNQRRALARAPLLAPRSGIPSVTRSPPLRGGLPGYPPTGENPLLPVMRGKRRR